MLTNILMVKELEGKVMEPLKGYIFSTGTSGYHGLGEEPPDGCGSFVQSNVSFKDKMIENKERAPSHTRRDLLRENLTKIEFENGNSLKKMVHIDDSVFDGLWFPWQDVLVVKLLGKSIGNNFFMLKFDLGEDKILVMDGGPWMVFDHYLAVQLWTPEFVALTATINKTMMWIRFPGLNLYFYDESVMLSLATTVGRPIKVDANTLDVKRGKFARVCVEVDTNKPMIGKVWMRGHWYMMEYEGLNCICSDCGCFGHFSHECMSPKPMKVVVPPPFDENIMEQTDEMELVSRAIPTNEIDPGPTKGTWR
ncbi:hypothetical protein D0Y65_033878 [Glycine soja]|uniref:DUF4283 domain-containing protein n=1 Tax=Glycine soja TaxID=3848 RepID=A0A445HN13_GLYSO|nr:hypothetical protein D0Y65_033878 [Glycine soja]